MAGETEKVASVTDVEQLVCTAGDLRTGFEIVDHASREPTELAAGLVSSSFDASRPEASAVSTETVSRFIRLSRASVILVF